MNPLEAFFKNLETVIRSIVPKEQAEFWEGTRAASHYLQTMPTIMGSKKEADRVRNKYDPAEFFESVKPILVAWDAAGIEVITAYERLEKALAASPKNKKAPPMPQEERDQAPKLRPATADSYRALHALTVTTHELLYQVTYYMPKDSRLEVWYKNDRNRPENDFDYGTMLMSLLDTHRNRMEKRMNRLGISYPQPAAVS